MHYPTISAPEAARQMLSVFGGYNHNLRIGDGELYDMKNLSGEDFPVLRSRRPRGVYASPRRASGMIARDTLCYVDGSEFVMDGYRIELGLSDSQKQLVSMGAYVIILPDKKYINTADLTDFGNIEAEVTTMENVTFDLCTPDGAGMNVKYHQAAEPEQPENGDYWVDAHVLRQFTGGQWTVVATTYIRIHALGIGKPFQKYDGVQISGLAGVDLTAENGEVFRDDQLTAIDGSFVLLERGDDYLVIAGMLDSTRVIRNTVTVSRRMPDMDFLIESENRLWGCRYGLSAGGQVVNELYASKLGDFKNWACYMGVSTDSYRVSLGSDGPFTGAIAHLGHPLFFKEECIHKVYGNYPANFQVQTTSCRGVRRGSSRSLAAVNAVLYYQSRGGVCAYDGSLPQEISAPLGDIPYQGGVGGSHGNRYYLSMLGPEGRSLFVYDTLRAVWHREDDADPLCFCTAREELYFIDNTDGKIKTVSGTGTPEGPVEWMAETGILGLDSADSKYFNKLALRVQLEPNAWLEASLEYDSSGHWEPVCHIRGGKLENFTVPIKPRRCDHMRLRLQGCGEAQIFSLTKTTTTSPAPQRTEGLHLFI